MGATEFIDEGFVSDATKKILARLKLNCGITQAEEILVNIKYLHDPFDQNQPIKVLLH